MTTLSAVKHYLEDHNRTTVEELARNLDTTPDNARVLLDMWREKKKIRLIPSRCGSCGKGALACACPEAARIPDIYEWIETSEGSTMP